MLILVASCPIKSYQFPKDIPLVGVDLGAMELAKRGLKMVAAIGDFDSSNKYDFDLMDKHAEKIVQLSQTKDLTDLEAAIVHFPNETEFVIYGALCGNRIDHLLNQFNIMQKYQDKSITFKDENNEITLLKKGKYIFNKAEKFKFYSFFVYNKAVINLNDGFKFPVNKQQILNNNTNFISNELNKDEAELEIIEGSVFVIKSDKL